MSQKKLFKKWIAFALALSCVSAAHALPTIGADAGLVPVEVTDAQLEKGVETTYWYATNDVVASSSSGKISFGLLSNASSRAQTVGMRDGDLQKEQGRLLYRNLCGGGSGRIERVVLRLRIGSFHDGRIHLPHRRYRGDALHPRPPFSERFLQLDLHPVRR